MNRDVFAGWWKQARGQAKTWWGQLTDDELRTIRLKLEAAGVPDVDEGEATAALITDAIGNLRSAFAQASSDAEDLSTDSPADFRSEAEAIAASLQESSEQIQESFETVDASEELREAADEVEACQEIQ